jgi:hypothetical protein
VFVHKFFDKAAAAVAAAAGPPLPPPPPPPAAAELPVRPVEVEGVRGQGPAQVRVRVDQARRAGRDRAAARAVRGCWRIEPGLPPSARDAGGGVGVSAGGGGGRRRRRVGAPPGVGRW